MNVTSRPAAAQDLPELVRLYRHLEVEMSALSEMWPLAGGLPEPVEREFASRLADDRALLRIGEIDRVPFGFVLATIDSMLPQAGGELLGSIRLIYVEDEAREVGLAEVMLDDLLAALRDREICRFDAHVLPGHRLAKNFFESGGFKARAIVMHRVDG